MLANAYRQLRQHLVYIDYLEVAPWNWSEPYADPPLYRGAGSVLIGAAINTSSEEGFGGRIGLHALPQAMSFYERCGMQSLGPDPDYQNLPYFEMTPMEAQAYALKGKKP